MLEKEYIIDTIDYSTLEEYGYDSSRVSDEMMEKIAETLRNTFRECVLVNLPQIADDYGIPKNPNPLYTVSRMYFSLNDERGNSYTTELFRNKEMAVAQLKQWREDELELRRESDSSFEIMIDDDENFRLTWDDDREILCIGVTSTSNPSD